MSLITRDRRPLKFQHSFQFSVYLRAVLTILEGSVRLFFNRVQETLIPILRKAQAFCKNSGFRKILIYANKAIWHGEKGEETREALFRCCKLRKVLSIKRADGGRLEFFWTLIVMHTNL